MTKEEKHNEIKILTKDLSEASNFYLADIAGLDSKSTLDLRRACFKSNIRISVVKNTLLKKAMEDSGKEFGDLKCYYCGWDKDKCDIHHIVPRVKGGTDEYSNLTIACPNCHRLIHKGKLKVGLTLEDYKNEHK